VLRHRTLYRQVVAKERRIALVETLNQSLIYFTRHLKKPVLQLLDQAGKIDPGSADTADFLDAVKRESSEILAALEGLEDEIKELEEADEALESRDISLEDLEEKFQSHFQELKRDVPDAKGVSR
jgi:chromosome segregation ATPase